MLKDIPRILESDILDDGDLALARGQTDQTSAHLLLSNLWLEQSPDSARLMAINSHHPVRIQQWFDRSQELVNYWAARATQYRYFGIQWGYTLGRQVNTGQDQLLATTMEKDGLKVYQLKFEDSLITESISIALSGHGFVEDDEYPKIRAESRLFPDTIITSIYEATFTDERVSLLTRNFDDVDIEGNDATIRVKGSIDFIRRIRNKRLTTLARRSP